MIKQIKYFKTQTVTLFRNVFSYKIISNALTLFLNVWLKLKKQRHDKTKTKILKLNL